MGFADGFFKNDKEHQLELIKMIRKYQPSIVITTATYDRHPDHGRASDLTRDACFLSGLTKIRTKLGGKQQAAHRPKAVYNYIQAIHIEPHFVVDITDHFDKKIEAIRAFRSQFFDPTSSEPETFISTPQFLEFVRARAIHFGLPAGVKYAEGFLTNRIPAIDDLLKLI
jgi:bacillithiol biosynthesis deacetylase BshB1